MKKFLKKYFVPHEDNDYKPHLFRETGALIIFSVTILLFIISISGHVVIVRTNLTALVLPKVLVDYANEDRQTESYKALAVSPILEKAAQLKANDMAEKGYFAHKSPEGHTPWYWFELAGYDFSFAGENLAVNFADSVDVNQAWMNSPGHRQNIMNGNFSEIGIATARGIYQGKDTVFVVQLFGRPAAPEPFIVISKPVITTKIKTTIAKTLATTTSVVLSETASSRVLATNGTNELFVAVEKMSASTSVTSNTSYSNIFEKIIMSPKKSFSLPYLILLTVIIISLVLFIFVEMERQHPRMILLALGLLVVILGLLYIYQSILFVPLLIV